MGKLQGAPGVAVLGRLVAAAGIASAMAGATAWITIRAQLAAERIVIPSSARWLPGRRVAGPVTAFAQAEAIRRSALAATEGRTYGELASDDPQAEMAMNASLLRSSLFTSVLAFGVAALQVGIGGVLVLVGSALMRLGRGPAHGAARAARMGAA